jgi:eukaryotic-like serine/threonine-protein kinase
MEATPPARIGTFEILREIGRGGMGVVYLAREGNERLVALKVLPREFTSDPVRMKRFRREAQTLSSVRHPNIVPVYQVGEADGLHFIAMKYIPGTSLDVLIRVQQASRQRLEDDTPGGGRDADLDDSWDARPVRRGGGPRPIKPLSGPRWTYRAVRVVEKIARALAHLHENGIVHRDVKPGNILIDQQGDPWLVDFGLVREVDSESVSDHDGILGTVQYVAPEQIEHEQTRPDPRSDLFSLGVSLYEAVTLKRPFDRRGTSSTLFAVAREAPVAPRVHQGGIPEDLERVILKALAKAPDLRYQTGTAFADDLRLVRTFKPVPPARTAVGRQLRQACARNPALVVAVVFAILSLIGMLEYAVYREMGDQRRRDDCREEADFAFDRGRFREAAGAYRLYLRLGGEDREASDRLAFCQDQEGPAPGDDQR